MKFFQINWNFFIYRQFSFVATFKKRNFVGQKSGPRQEAGIIIEKHITRECNGDAINWSEKEHPDKSDEDKFIAIQGKRRILTPSELTQDILRKMRGSDVTIYVHTYSDNVASAAVFKSVDRILLQPEQTDRSGAASVQAQMGLVDELQQKHGDYLSGHQLAWMAWAHAIQRADPSVQESMKSTAPPPHVLRLFRSAPTAESI